MTATPMALGPFQFRADGVGFQKIDRDIDAGWATVPVVNALDALQALGPKHEKVRIRGVVFPHEWGGLEILAGLRAFALAQQPQFLITMNGDLLGLFAIMKVGEDQSLHDALGTPRRDAYTISLTRYQGSLSSALGGALRLFS